VGEVPEQVLQLESQTIADESQVRVEELYVNPDLQVRQLSFEGPSHVWQVESHDPHKLLTESK
jgi:hypothetical protein